jgi:Ni/Co efflux regulator RcnB
MGEFLRTKTGMVADRRGAAKRLRVERKVIFTPKFTRCYVFNRDCLVVATKGFSRRAKNRTSIWHMAHVVCHRQMFQESTMKKSFGTLLICGLIAMSCAAGVSAQPQDHQDQDHHDQGPGPQGHAMYDRGRKEGWYKKGGHVPAEYNGGTYAVSDWRSNHLRQPPRGYHYVRSDNGDFLLVAISTGVIASIIASH